MSKTELSQSDFLSSEYLLSVCVELHGSKYCDGFLKSFCGAVVASDSKNFASMRQSIIDVLKNENLESYIEISKDKLYQARYGLDSSGVDWALPLDFVNEVLEFLPEVSKEYKYNDEYLLRRLFYFSFGFSYRDDHVELFNCSAYSRGWLLPLNEWGDKVLKLVNKKYGVLSDINEISSLGEFANFCGGE